jgi:hypothetical protein
MANICSNYMTFTGSKENLDRFKSDLECITDKDEFNLFHTLVGDVEWGTNRDTSYNEACIDYQDDSINMSPGTAWSPADKFCFEVCKKYELSCVIYYDEGGNDFCGRTTMDFTGVFEMEDYTYREGSYLFNVDGFWEDINYDADDAIEEEKTLEEFLNDYPYVTKQEDKEALADIYNENKKTHGELED